MPFLFDRSPRGKLLIRGSGAAEFLQGQVTNDVEALEPGGGCYAALLNHKGKMRTDMRLLRGEDWIWIDTEPEGLPAIAGTVSTYSIGYDVTLEDVSAERAILSVIDAGPPGPEHTFTDAGGRVTVATDLGYDVICPAGEAGEVRAELGLEEAGEEDAERVRIESGRPRFGRELTGDTIPQEGGINERAVSFEKGCYVGQETVARLHWRGKPNRTLRGLRLSAPAAQGEPIVLGEREVGTVGSATVSPALGPIALAIVRREAQDGAEVAVGGRPAKVVSLPFSR
ncbi:MAG: folate-binding protein YgfZ [Thermoleophilaceae bacterium]|nr:folate-binding protein YgfZ [Thermoleophilaceae bacterium]